MVNFTYSFDDKGNAEIKNQCPLCGKKNCFSMPRKDFLEGVQKLGKGNKIQEAFPSLTSAQREMMITGVCSTCWEETFAIEDEEKEE